MNEIKMKVKTFVEDMLVVFSVYIDDKRQYAESFDFNDLPEDGDIRNQVSLYGLKKLLSDRTSAVTDKGDKLAEMKQVMLMLRNGVWSKERTIGFSVVSIEVEALADLKGISIPAVQKALSEYDKETRKKILASPAIQAHKVKMQKAREEAAGVDLLAEFGSE